MVGLCCKSCGFDLSLRVDLIVRAMKNNYEDGEFPSDVAVDGCCDECKAPFCYSGEMFAKFLQMKAEEGVINPRADNFMILEFDIDQDKLEQVRKALKEGNAAEIQALIIKLMAEDERPDKD